MLYVRGNRRDYDLWEALGNPGWSYRRVLPFFKKSEDNRNPYLANNSYHSSGGYLTVQESPFRTPLALAFIKAGEELGYDKNKIISSDYSLVKSSSNIFLKSINIQVNGHYGKYIECFGVKR